MILDELSRNQAYSQAGMAKRPASGPASGQRSGPAFGPRSGPAFAIFLLSARSRSGPLLLDSGPPLHHFWTTLHHFWTTLYYPGCPPCTTQAALYYPVPHHPGYTRYITPPCSASSMPAAVTSLPEEDSLGSEGSHSLGRVPWAEYSGQSCHGSSRRRNG